MGRATIPEATLAVATNISIHALRGEGDVYRTIYSSSQPGQFQSTPSVGRATCGRLDFSKITATFQSTPSVGRATCGRLDFSKITATFQSTPSVGRATCGRLDFSKITATFQSTPSVGRATGVLSIC